jgi:hypothetical protein
VDSKLRHNEAWQAFVKMDTQKQADFIEALVLKHSTPLCVALQGLRYCLHEPTTEDK